jgi:hypothetical protein
MNTVPCGLQGPYLYHWGGLDILTAQYKTGKQKNPKKRVHKDVCLLGFDAMYSGSN